MAITKIDQSLTISSTEISLATGIAYSSGSPQTTSETIQIGIDCSNIAAGDSFRIRVYESYGSSGTQRVVYEAFPPPGTKQYIIPALIVTDSWDVTLLKSAGTDRVFKTSIRQVA